MPTQTKQYTQLEVDKLLKDRDQKLKNEYTKCQTCGTPLSRDCQQCKKDWES